MREMKRGVSAGLYIFGPSTMGERNYCGWEREPISPGRLYDANHNQTILEKETIQV